MPPGGIVESVSDINNCSKSPFKFPVFTKFQNINVFYLRKISEGISDQSDPDLNSDSIKGYDSAE